MANVHNISSCVITNNQMTKIEQLKEAARSAATAEIFGRMASKEASAQLLKQIRTLPDAALDGMAKVSGVPPEQFHIHRAIVRGEPNEFMEELGKIDGLLQAGDVILMTGKSLASQSLAHVQKAVYGQARSSHVAMVHADLISIDAMPKIGVTNRIISEVLSDVEDNWRVIRHQRVQKQDLESIARSCVFYLAQPYKILPSGKSAKKFSYCSELVRKVYRDSRILDTGIPNNLVVKPANFDQLADHHPQWKDITDSVRPAVDLCRKYPELISFFAKLFIEGLKLNRKRFDERTATLAYIQRAVKAGKISREKAMEMTQMIKKIENNMNHNFWDVRRKD